MEQLIKCQYCPSQLRCFNSHYVGIIVDRKFTIPDAFIAMMFIQILMKIRKLLSGDRHTDITVPETHEIKVGLCVAIMHKFISNASLNALPHIHSMKVSRTYLF